MNTLETQVLELIGEDTASPDVFADTSAGMAPIRDSINDAIQEISIVTGSYKNHYMIPLRANKTFFRMKFRSDHFAWVTDAWLVNQKRRLVQTPFVEKLRWVLAPGGHFHAATDWDAYARQMRGIMEAADGFTNWSGSGKFYPGPVERPLTKFEKRGLKRGHEVRDLLYERTPRVLC